MSALEKYGQASGSLKSKFLKSAQMEDSLYSSSQTTMKSLDIDDNEITESDSDSRENTNNPMKNDTYNGDSNSLDVTSPNRIQAKEVSESLIDTQLFDIDKPVKTANLMSLLSGKQSETKSKKKPDTAPLVVETDVDSSIDEDVANSSFTDFKADTLRKEYDLIELERKFYKQGTKSVTSKDFLGKLKMSNGTLKRENGTKRANAMKSKKIDNSNPEVIDLSQNSKSEDKSILIISDDEDETKVLESKVFSDTKKSSSVRDLLKPLKDNTSKLNKKKKEKPKDTAKPILYVTLKINSASLAEIKKYENPLKTRGNFNKSLELTCKSEVQTFDMKSLSSSSFFQSMMDASKSETKLRKYQSSMLEVPSISKDAFHVVPLVSLNHETLQITLPRKNYNPKPLSHIIEAGDKSVLSNTPSTYNSKFKVKRGTLITKDYIKKTIPSINDHILLLNIYENYVMKNYYNDECMLWVDFFQPKDITQVLISPNNQKLIAGWISNAYSNLKVQSLKNPRNLLIKKKRNKLSTLSEMGDFIVDDFGDDFQEPYADTNVFIPLLIIQGSTGSCKSSSVYAYMNQINGYVYEINSGQHRGKKDILNNLKEFATTQLVHRQGESKEFQKGLVLFEDVNILYEQDKNFWQVIQEIINISRRPIVLTCDTLENIPKNILKYAITEDSIINLDKDILSRSVIKDYLWLCSISQDYNIDTKILDDILLESYNGSNYDLRKCLMKCQYLCSVEKMQSEIEYNDDQHSIDLYDEATSLSDLASEFELASISDVIRENSRTQINHEPVQNEFTDISYIDSLAQLHPTTLPYELNIGEEIQKKIKRSSSMKLPILTYQIVRDIVTDFISSRAKKLPKLLLEMQNIPKRQTRSARSLSPDSFSYSEIPETTGIMESSFLKFSTNTALITELLPFSRDWLRFQVTLEKFEVQQIENEKPSIKSFLKYRDFHYNSKDLLQTLNYLDLLKIIDNCES